MKTVIFSKSCSRCGGSLVFKGQTLQKSVPRATPNDNGARKRKKSVPAPSPDALFRPRARFLSIFGCRPGLKNSQKPSLAKVMTSTDRRVFRFFCVFFARVRSGRLPDRFRRLRGPCRARFRKDFPMFFGTFLRNLACVGGFRRGVAGIHRQPPELTLRGAFWGTAISRSDLNSPYPNGVLAWF